MEVFPNAGGFLPTSLQEYRMWEEYGKARSSIGASVDPISDIQSIPAGKAQQIANETAERVFTEYMAGINRESTIDWFDYTPGQRLRAAGAINSPVLLEMLQVFDAVFEEVDAHPEYTRGSNLVRAEIIGPTWRTYRDTIVSDPQTLDEFLEIGYVLFEESNYDEIFEKLVLGKIDF